MAGKSGGTKIRGMTLKIDGDTSGVVKALSGMNSQISNTQSQLKDIERLLKLDPKNTELLRQKQELLARAIGETEEKLKKLENAEKLVQEQFKEGKISQDQYNALRREIVAAEMSLDNLKDEAKKTEDAINGVDEKPVEEVAKAAKEAEKSIEGAGKEASNFKELLKAEAVVEGAKSIIGALKDVAEETKEYKKIMGSLEVSSERAGYGAEETGEVFKELYGVLGDDQTAATTTANLQALGLSQERLKEMTNAAIGAWASYGDSIPIDGLAESINETIKAGTVTGTFADVLNWAALENETFGVSLKENTKANEEWNKAVSEAETAEDYFNLALQDASTEAERANLVMQMLADQGLTEAGKAWKENNKSLVENNQANAELQEQMAELGEKVMPIVTSVIEKVAELLEWFNGLDEDTQNIILLTIALVAALGPLTGAIGGVSDAISFLAANPIVALIAAIIALVALIAVKGDEIQDVLQKVDDFMQNIFAKDWTEVFGPVLGNALNGFFANLKNIWDSAKVMLNGIIDFIRGVFTGDWERAWNGVKEIFGGMFQMLVSLAKAPLNSVISLINGMIDGINWVIRKVNGLSFTNPFTGKNVGFHFGEIGKVPYLANGGILSQGSAVVGEAGPELLTMMGNRAIVQPLTNQTTNTSYLGGMTVNVYGAPGQDVKELADLVADKVQAAVQRQEAVYA
jgi:hypothetical protein